MGLRDMDEFQLQGWELTPATLQARIAGEPDIDVGQWRASTAVRRGGMTCTRGVMLGRCRTTTRRVCRWSSGCGRTLLRCRCRAAPTCSAGSPGA